MRDRTTYAWAVLLPFGNGWYKPGSPLTDSIRPTRQSAMHNFVADWRTSAHNGLTVSAVWQRAYRRGWRLARVSITPICGY